jgi:ABC-type antimicrobial peptide transport system permease subunit
MKLLEGIQLHELVLIILGFILGLVLIFVFLYGALRGKTNLKLLFGFIAPLIMIGYPSIQSIEFSKDVVKIDKLVERVKTNPMDTLAAKELISQISTLPKSRCVTSSDALSTIANAQAAVGLYDSAKVTIQKAVLLNSKSEKVVQSRQEIVEQWENHRDFKNKVDVLKENLDRLNANPKNTKLRDTLAQNLDEIKRINSSTHASQSDVLAVGMATAIVGQYQAAEQVADNVLRVSPNQVDAQKLKDDIRDNKIKQRFPPKKETQKPRPENPKPTDRVRVESDHKPPVVAAPAAIKLDTNWQSKLIPKATRIAKDFVKWDKEQ